MIHNILKAIGGIEQYGTASLCLFSTIFAAVLVWALLQRKGHLDRMSRVPLEDDSVDALTGRNSHE
jgi:hypothetical protein